MSNKRIGSGSGAGKTHNVRPAQASKQERLEGKYGQRSIKDHTRGDDRVQGELKARLALVGKGDKDSFEPVDFKRLQTLHKTDRQLVKQQTDGDQVNIELNRKGYRLGLFSGNMQRSLSARNTSKINTNVLDREMRFQRKLKGVMTQHRDFKTKLSDLSFKHVDRASVNSSKKGWDWFTEVTGLRLFRNQETVKSNKKSIVELLKTLERAGISKDMLSPETVAMLQKAKSKGVLLSKTELARLEREVGDLKYIDQVVNSEWGTPVSRQSLPKVTVPVNPGKEELLSFKEDLSKKGYPDLIANSKDPRTFQFYRYGQLETVNVRNEGQLKRLQTYLDECHTLSVAASQLHGDESVESRAVHEKLLRRAEKDNRRLSVEEYTQFQEAITSSVSVDRASVIEGLVNGKLSYFNIEEEYPFLFVETKSEGAGVDKEIDVIERDMLRDAIKIAGYPILEKTDDTSFQFLALNGNVITLNLEKPEDVKNIQTYLTSVLELSNRIDKVKPAPVKGVDRSREAGIVGKILGGEEAEGPKGKSSLERIEEEKSKTSEPVKPKPINKPPEQTQ